MLLSVIMLLCLNPHHYCVLNFTPTVSYPPIPCHKNAL